MKHSKFNDDMKRSIILEKLQEGCTIQEICKKYNISPNTYHLWKRELENSMSLKEVSQLGTGQDIENVVNENKILRRLYINLSAHNYELAKFLNN